MILFFFIYYLQFVYQTESSSHSNEINTFYLTEEQQNTIKERLYCYIKNFDENTLNGKEEIYEQVLQELKNTFTDQVYQFFEKKKIPVTKEMISEILSQLNELISKEIYDMLRNLYNERWPLNPYRRRRSECKLKCLSYLEKNELEYLLSYKISTINFILSFIVNRNIFYINKVKEKLKKKQRLLF